MRVLTSGAVLGIGLGGFVDGIVLHQIMQWHNMMSAVVPPLTVPAMHYNMLWDGLFHAATWLITLAGIWMLWARRGTDAATAGIFAAQMLFGWGVFNLVEGVIDHHLLALHHVRDMPAHVPIYDWLFLGIGGVLFILIGAAGGAAAAHRHAGRHVAR